MTLRSSVPDAGAIRVGRPTHKMEDPRWPFKWSKRCNSSSELNVQDVTEAIDLAIKRDRGNPQSFFRQRK